MNSKFYVSLEAARLLKEKGYNECISTFYNEDGLLLEVVAYYNLVFLAIEDLNNDHYPALTKAEAIDWLESKGKIIEVFQDYRGLWFYVIKISETESYLSESDDNYFSTRLETEEAAIIKALKLLKNKN